MKVSIGTNIKEGPWGGGNLFAKNLMKSLNQNGHKAYNDLKEIDLDIILITEPRKTSESSAFTYDDVKNYLKYINSKTIVLHRINECDERKQTNYVNKYLIYTNKIADSTIFVSNWLKNLYHNQNIQSKDSHVIMAGADNTVFNSINKNLWDGKSKLKLVTHHWGANWNKGFDIYLALDRLLENKQYKEKFEFTYIGNIPKEIQFNNTKVMSPLSGGDLAEKIKENHIYLTASINEPSGNHHIEGAQCGLPLLYINSGGIPEYCNGFGIMFDKSNFEACLNKIRDDYFYFEKKIKFYPNNSEKMGIEYINLFENILSNKNSFISKRDKKLYNKSYLEKFVYLGKRKLKGFK